MNEWYICPRCYEMNTDNWPVTTLDGTVQEGGCQACWEDECAAGWWQEMASGLGFVCVDSAIMEGVR